MSLALVEDKSMNHWDLESKMLGDLTVICSMNSALKDSRSLKKKRARATIWCNSEATETRRL